MVGGPSEVYASSGAAVFCAGMNPLSLKDLLKGCLLVAFFENLPVLPYRCSKINPSFFFDKAGCTRQYESELSLRSFASLFPIKEGSTSFSKPFFSWRRLAALGNMKARFHCAHLHNLSPQGTRDVPTALSIVFTTPSVPLIGDRNGAQTASL